MIQGDWQIQKVVVAQPALRLARDGSGKWNFDSLLANPWPMKSMGKGAIADAVIGESGLKRSQVMSILNAIGEVAGTEVKSAGKFVLPGVCMIKTRTKPATKAGKRMMFGKEVVVKAKAAKMVVKAFPVKAIKSQF